MDEWKIGEGGLFGGEEPPNKKAGKKEKNPEGEFSIGSSPETNWDNYGTAREKDGGDEPVFYGNRPQKKGRGNFRKVFYVIVVLGGIISIFYLVNILTLPKNDIKISMFDLKEITYIQDATPGNNLAITGYLINNNEFPVGLVRLSCKILDGKNAVIKTKYVYAGNYIKTARLKSLSKPDVESRLTNRWGDNMADMSILPFHPVRIMVVFFNIPSNVKSYSITIDHFYRIKK